MESAVTLTSAGASACAVAGLPAVRLVNALRPDLAKRCSGSTGGLFWALLEDPRRG